MRLARDRFVAGVRADYIQENLLQTPPDSLEDAHRVAKCLEADADVKQSYGSTFPRGQP